jgi:hypothetical protein
MSRILCEEHPDTISAMNNLASTLGDQGQLDEAAKMKKEVLERWAKERGIYLRVVEVDLGGVFVKDLIFSIPCSGASRTWAVRT